MSEQNVLNNPQDNVTNRQRSLLRGPLLSAKFSILYISICCMAAFVIHGPAITNDEIRFMIMTLMGFCYYTFVPALALYLMSRGEKSEERMTRIELRDRRFNREFEMALDRKRNQDFLAEVKRLLEIEEDIFEV